MKKRFQKKNGKGIKRGRRALLTFFVGRVVLTGEEQRASELLSLCIRYALSYGEFTVGEDGRFYLSATYASAEKIRAVASAHGVALTVLHRQGFREVLRLIAGRPGLPIGAILAVLLVVFASSRLWEIRITGNDTLSRGEVVSELLAAGLSLGDAVAEIDVDAIENRLLMHSERISWITVNLIGTVAEVQIREKLPARETVDVTPANLVARCDGVIVSLDVRHGNVQTKVGAAVRAGEVLVSGVYDSETVGLRCTRADGTVLAETEHTFTVEVPYAYERIVCTETLGRRYELIFFGARHLLREESGCSGENAVERVSYLRVFGKDLPIGLSVTSFFGTETVSGEYDAERAMEIAYYRLSEEIAALPEMMGVLEKEISCEILDSAYVLHCRIRCIEDIAETKNIEINLFE